MANVSKFYFNSVYYGQIKSAEISNIQDNVQVAVIKGKGYANTNNARQGCDVVITYPNDEVDIAKLFNELSNDVSGDYSKTLSSEGQNFGGGIPFHFENVSGGISNSDRFNVVAVKKVEPAGVIYADDGSTDVVFSKVTISAIRYPKLITKK